MMIGVPIDQTTQFVVHCWVATVWRAPFLLTTLLATILAAGSYLNPPQLAAQDRESDERAARQVDFSRDVKPLLARRCFACHGPSDAEGGLQLHQSETALVELDSGALAIVPGSPDESELIVRVTAEDEYMRMPPEGEPLTADEIGLLRDWITQGAAWDAHWAFQPRGDPAPPPVQNSERVRSPIDAFVLHQLEAAGLEAAEPADRIAWLRRATYNAIGLPPTPGEVQDFLSDMSSEAYETVVDRLLDSPHYGERWGRHWLDLVRFAETNSFERDGRKPHAWRYRDYVIRSLNDDKPYDQFILEQLAGDELPEPTPDSITATGFYRLGVWDDEPADPLQAKYDGFDDILSTISEAFFGLTVGCARCHDHKIDPIPQEDYYSLLAFLHGITPMGNGGPRIEQPLFANEEERQAYQRQVEDLEQRRNAAQLAISQWEARFRRAAGLSDDVRQPDLDDLEYRFYRDSFQRLPDFDRLKPETVERLHEPYFDIRPATRDDSFGFVFTGILKVPEDGSYTFTLDSDDGSRLTIANQVVVDHDGIHGVGDPQQATVMLSAGRLPIRLDYFQAQHDKGLAVTWSGPNFPPRYLSATTADGTPVEELRKQPIDRLIKELGPQVMKAEELVEYERLGRRLERLKRERVPAEFALCVTEEGPEAPETFVMFRGNPHVPRDRVEPRFPGIFGAATPEIPPRDPGATTSGRRLALARWIVSPDNMLTSRVIVNRIWQHHFGRGLVRTANNFGELGDAPTHPELLDWLASELIRHEWRLKPLHRLIMLSSVYRMSSRGQPEGLARDPNNDLFWRFNMRRLSAEEIRDSIFGVNGRLNRKMFGPGYYPDISAEVLAGQSQPGSGWGDSSPEEQARRSVYIHVKRSLITPLLAGFDYPETDTSCEARFTTTQPGQALSMLNGEFVHQEAAHFADRLRHEAGDDPEARIRRGLELAIGHVPEAEVTRGLELLTTLDEQHDVEPEAAFTLLCLVILNLNEFVYLD
jgi:hypothetical protein